MAGSAEEPGSERRPLGEWADTELCARIGLDPAILAEDDAQIIAALVDALTGAQGHEARKPIRELLGRVGARRPDVLADHLTHGNCFTRWEVVNVLGELAAPSTLERTVEFALNEDEVHARWRSFWAVSRFDRARTVPLLLEALNGGDQTRRWRAALMLSMLNQAEAGPVLVEGLDHPERWIQWEALSAIKSLGVAGAEDRVAAFLAEDQAIELRQEATLALGGIGTEDAKNHLLRALHDPSPQVRWRAVMALARYGGPEVERQLQMQGTCDSDPIVRQFIVEELPRIASRCGKNPL